MPHFSFYENRRTGYQDIQKAENQVIIVEGLYAIKYKNILTDAKSSVFSIFVTADESIRLKRIGIRDSKERGRPTSSLEKRFHFIKVAEKKWIMKQQYIADLVIDTSDNIFDEYAT
jgi:uridine kinase